MTNFVQYINDTGDWYINSKIIKYKYNTYFCEKFFDTLLFTVRSDI